jgi:invasion protein IalB
LTAKQDLGWQRVALVRRAARAALALAAVCLAATALAQDRASAGAEPARLQAMSVEAADSERDERHRSLDKEVQALKKEVLDLNRDLFLLEEELLFPANSQVAFFVSMDVGEYFELDSVNIQIDGKEVANYLYTERETEALLRGGVHRIHMANLKTGTH